MILISGHCSESQLVRIQTAVKASDGRFTHCYTTLSGRYYYEITFDTAAGADYTAFHKSLENTSYVEKTPGIFKKLKNKIIGLLKN